jgi:radical SAM protein with 4Fe4S-binding SPASM domain
MNKIKFHTSDKMDKCKICDFKLICGGSCQARNFLENGNLNKVGDFCECDKLAIIHEIINAAEMQEL